MISFFSRLVVGLAIIGMLGFSASLAASEVGEGEINNPSWDSDNEAPDGDFQDDNALHTDIDKGELSPDGAEVKGQDFSDTIESDPINGTDPMDPLVDPVPDDGPTINDEATEQLADSTLEGDDSVDADASEKAAEDSSGGEGPEDALDQNKRASLGMAVSISSTSGMLSATVPVSNTRSIAAGWSLGLHAVYNYQAYSYVPASASWLSQTQNRETAYNAMVSFAYNWGWQEQALVYIKREYDVTPDNPSTSNDEEKLNTWYDYYELYRAGSTIRFYREEPIHSTSEEPEAPGGIYHGLYAAEIYAPSSGCDPKCGLDYGSDNKAELYTRDGSDLRMILEKDPESDEAQSITIQYPDGSFQVFNQFPGATNYHGGDEYFPSLVAGQGVGLYQDYAYKALRRPYYLVYQGSYQKMGGLKYNYGSEAEMLTVKDPAGYTFKYYPLRSICDVTNGSRCLTIDYANYNSSNGDGTLVVKSMGYAGAELAWELVIDDHLLKQIKTPEMQAGGATETGEIDIEYRYDDDNIDENLLEEAPKAGGPRQVVSKIVPLHLAGTNPDFYYEFVYTDPSDGDHESVLRTEWDLNNEGQDNEMFPLVYGRVSNFYRVLGDKEEVYRYSYDVSAEDLYYAEQFWTNVPCGDCNEDYQNDQVEIVWKYARGYRTVTIVDPEGNTTKNTVSVYLNRLPNVNDENSYAAYIDDNDIYFETAAQIYSGQFEDIPFENTAIAEKLRIDHDDGCDYTVVPLEVNCGETVYDDPPSYQIEYPGSPSGKLLRSQYYTPDLNDPSTLIIRSQSDYAYRRGYDYQGQFQDIYRLEEKVNWSIGDDGTKLISSEHYSYEDTYGRLTRTELYQHKDASDGVGTLVKDTKSQYTSLVDSSHWFCGNGFVNQVKEKELNASSPYYNWPHHDGYVQKFYQWFDFNLDQGNSGRLIYKEVGDNEAEDGAQTHKYIYLTSMEAYRGMPGQLAETYWYLPGGEEQEWGEHYTVSPKVKYSYDMTTGIPIKEETIGVMDSAVMTNVTRTVDYHTGLITSESYLGGNGGKKDMKYDSLGRPVQTLTWSVPVQGVSTPTTPRTVTNMEYQDLGATIVSWVDRSSSPLYLEADEMPVFQSGDTSGHFDQWAKSTTDLFGRLVSEEKLGPRGSASSSDYPILKRRLTYDEKDRIIESTDFNSGAADGNVNKTEYDALGRVVWEKSASGVTVTYKYPTPLSKIVSMTIKGVVQERRYDSELRGRLSRVSELLPEGSDPEDADNVNVVDYRYDYADRMIDAISNGGEQRREWYYSTAGVLLVSSYPENSDSAPTMKLIQNGVCGPEIWRDAKGNELQNLYTSWCELDSVRDPDDAESGDRYLGFRYDFNHRLETRISYQDEVGDSWIQENFYYDPGNNISLAQTIIHYRDNPEVSFHTRYRYNGQNKMLSLDYPSLVTFGDSHYDENHHGVAYSYDASGAPASIMRGDFNSGLTTISNVSLNGQWDFAYEPTWGGLKQYVFNKGASSVTLNRALDNVGRLKSYEAMIGSGSSTSGTRSSLSTPTTSSTMKPKTAKQKTGGSKIGQTGQTNTIVNPDPMAPINGPSGNTASTLFSGTHSYDTSSGLLIARGTSDELLQNKIHRREVYGYDPLGRLTAAFYNKNRNGTEKTIWKEWFNHDRNGNLSDAADGTAAYRVEIPIAGVTEETSFVVDRATNRLTETVLAGASTEYAYDKNGNLSSVGRNEEVTQSFGYNRLNHLYRYTNNEANLSAEYLYNGAGLRLLKRVVNEDGNEEILYTLYAKAAPGAQQLATFKQSGSSVPQMTERLFYTQLGPAYRDSVMSTPYSTFLIPNYLGEVEFVVKESDKTYCARKELAFGDPIPQAAEAYLTIEKDCVDMMEAGDPKDKLVSLGFGTHQQDLESKFRYMHLRFYDHVSKRFSRPDPLYDIDINRPQSWNLYTYVSNNPIGGIDPTGGGGVEAPPIVEPGLNSEMAETVLGAYFLGVAATEGAVALGAELV